MENLVHFRRVSQDDEAMGWTFGFWQVQAICPLCIYPREHRTDVGSTKPPVQRTPDSVSLGVMRPERGTGPSSPSNAEFKKVLSFKSAPPLHFYVVHRDKFFLVIYRRASDGRTVCCLVIMTV